MILLRLRHCCVQMKRPALCSILTLRCSASVKTHAALCAIAPSAAVPAEASGQPSSTIHAAHLAQTSNNMTPLQLQRAARLLARGSAVQNLILDKVSARHRRCACDPPLVESLLLYQFRQVKSRESQAQHAAQRASLVCWTRRTPGEWRLQKQQQRRQWGTVLLTHIVYLTDCW